MGELRIEVNYKPVRHYRRDLMIGFLLIVIPIVVDIIFIAFGIRFLIGYFSIMVGIIVIGVQLYFLWKIPLYVEFADLGIYFHHWRNFSKGPRFISWLEVESIWPSNKIRLKNGSEKNINFLKRSDLDRILDFLIMHDLSFLVRGQYADLMDYSRPKRRPTIILKRSGGEKDNTLYIKVLMIFFAVCEFIFLMGLGITFLIIEIEMFMAFLFCFFAVPVVEVILFVWLKKPLKTMELSVSPEGVRFKKGRKKDLSFDWGEIASISSWNMDAEGNTYSITIHSTDGRRIGFNDQLISRRSHTDLFWAMNEYCLYYGIPVRDGANHLKVKGERK